MTNVGAMYSYRLSSLLIATLILGASVIINGYSNGAPDRACWDMIPMHGVKPMTSSSPYTISTSLPHYSDGQVTVNVSLSGSTRFEGYLLEFTGWPQSTGRFVSLPTDAQLVCDDEGVTHSNKAQKDNVTVTWTSTAPSTSHANVTFIATVVQTFDQFWTGIQSTALMINQSSTATLTHTIQRFTNVTVPTISHTTQSVPQQSADIDTSTCNTAKSCFLDRCSNGKCGYVLTWSCDEKSQAVSFELAASVASIDSWVGFGQSIDQRMGDDSVTECVYNDQTNVLVIRQSWNKGHSNQVLKDQVGLVPGSLSGGYVNGRIVCRFQRLISVPSQSDVGTTVYPLDSATYYILIAQGPASAGVKSIHLSTTVSSTAVNFSAATYQHASGSTLERNLLKAHGILMVSAWLVFASFGMLLPRYCKSAWAKTLWCGKKVWFQIHQPCMVATLLATAAGFIIIFVEAKGYAELPWPYVAHPPLGIIVMALVLLNPIGALFRCEPTDKRRPVFNVIHFTAGVLAHVSAVIAIFLGLNITRMNLPQWTNGVMAGYVVFHVVMETVMALHMHRQTLCPTTNDLSSIQLEPLQSSSTTTSNKVKSQPSKGSTFTTVALVIHLTGVTTFASVLCVTIALS